MGGSHTMFHEAAGDAAFDPLAAGISLSSEFEPSRSCGDAPLPTDRMTTERTRFETSIVGREFARCSAEGVPPLRTARLRELASA